MPVLFVFIGLIVHLSSEVHFKAISSLDEKSWLLGLTVFRGSFNQSFDSTGLNINDVVRLSAGAYDERKLINIKEG